MRSKRDPKYINPCAGQKCGGVCDLCHRNAVFIWHGWGIVCSAHARKVSSNKLKVKSMNFLLTDSCLVCRRRQQAMFKVNYGFCPDCLKKIGKGFKRNQQQQIEVTRNNLKRFERKTNTRVMDEEAKEEYRKRMKKKRGVKYFLKG